MANKVTPSIAPGAYAGAQTVSWSFDPSVAEVAFTINGLQPAISEYIAYDQSDPPVPFLAVTQDGAGNVVYDGGFPKFYNNQNTTGAMPGDEYSVRLIGTVPSTAGNSYHYDVFSETQIVINTGDILSFEIWIDGPEFKASVDALLENGAFTSFRGFDITDQNGKLINGNTATPEANRAWHYREFDLSAADGCTTVNWAISLEGDAAGTYQANVRNVKLYKANLDTSFDILNADNPPTVSGTQQLPSVNYTSVSRVAGTPHDVLTPQMLFARNALDFIASSAKVAAGNRNFLVLGDKSAAPYTIKGTGINDFYTAFETLAKSGSWQFTYKDISDYGGELNPTLTELNNYVGVILMSSNTGSVNGYISDTAVTDLLTFRSTGNGLLVITDHGPIVPNIGSAWPLSATGFFATANKLIRNFGAWFSGDYARSPVNVGYIRTNYGDHPLFDGMDNADNIYAGASESRIFVNELSTIDPATMPDSNLDNGTHQVRFLVKLDDGSLESYTFVYVVATGDLIEFKDKDNNPITDIDVGWDYRLDISASVLGAGLGTILGSIYINDKKVGELFFDDANGSKEIWYSGESIRVNNGDVVKAAIDQPFTYERTTTVTRLQPDIDDINGLAEIVQDLSFLSPSARRDRIISLATTEVSQYYPSVYAPGGAKNVQQLKNYLSNNLPLTELNVYAYDLQADVIDALGRLVPTVPPVQEDTREDIILDMLNNRVYRYFVDVWQLVPGITAHDVFGAPRRIKAIEGIKTYQLNTNGTISIV